MHTDLDALAARFLGLFDNRAGRAALDGLEDVFLPRAVIARQGPEGLQVMTLAEFIEPRRRLLSDGSLIGFHEWEEASETFSFGGIATRICRYRKEGLLHGKPYTGAGLKSLHLLRTGQGWRISSVVWEDFGEDSLEWDWHRTI